MSYPPYIFECLLYAPVDDRNSTAQVGNGTVIFKMLKQELGKWERLQSEHAGTVKTLKNRQNKDLSGKCYQPLLTIKTSTDPLHFSSLIDVLFMLPKELWEAYSNCTVRPCVRPCVRPAFVSGPYLLYSLR